MAKLNYKSVTCLSFILMFVSFIGCATIFKGSHAEIRVNSEPSGATIMINGIDKGETPKTLALERDEDYVLTFQKEGYKEVKVEVESSFDFATTVLGNLVSWSLLGVVVDVASGAAYSLSPADIQANLEELKEAGIINAIPQQRENEITVIMLTKAEWQSVNND